MRNSINVCFSTTSLAISVCNHLSQREIAKARYIRHVLGAIVTHLPTHLFHNGGTFFFFHMYINEPFWSRLKVRILRHFAHVGLFIIIHIKEYINSPPL